MIHSLVRFWFLAVCLMLCGPLFEEVSGIVVLDWDVAQD